MLILLLLVLLLAQVSPADETWYFPFTELGAEWTAEGGWTIDPTGGHYGYDREPGGTDWSYSRMYSGYMELPGSFDSLTIDWVNGYYYYGYAMDGGSEVSMQIEADTGMDPIALFSLQDGVNCWNYQSYTGSDTSSIAEGMSILPGDSLQLTFTGGTNSYGYIHYVDLDWSVWDLAITGHDGTAVQRETWAGIKASF